jgi:hypothetical protein
MIKNEEFNHLIVENRSIMETLLMLINSLIVKFHKYWKIDYTEYDFHQVLQTVCL